MERKFHWIAELGLPLPMNPPLERDRSPVAAAPTACSCRNPPQVADCIRARCAPGRRALRTPADSPAQGAFKVRGVLSWVRDFHELKIRALIPLDRGKTSNI